MSYTIFKRPNLIGALVELPERCGQGWLREGESFVDSLSELKTEFPDLDFQVIPFTRETIGNHQVLKMLLAVAFLTRPKQYAAPQSDADKIRSMDLGNFFTTQRFVDTEASPKRVYAKISRLWRNPTRLPHQLCALKTVGDLADFGLERFLAEGRRQPLVITRPCILAIAKIFEHNGISFKW